LLKIPQKAGLRRSLLSWFRHHQRLLPWRENRDPYRIWVSEIMLQQTRVLTVIPYYRRFFEKFPRIEDLAQASLSEVLHLWAGLGYYSRARNLKKTAEIIFRDYAGSFPTQHEKILALPGIGRYTAGAIASIAFGQAYPLVDGNVARVFLRLMGWEDESSGIRTKRLWALAVELLPDISPGDFNEALMELGATICLPRLPRCSLCPWKLPCLARRRHRQECIPAPTKRPLPHAVRMAVFVVTRRKSVLLFHRQEDKWLQGFWDFPQMEYDTNRPILQIAAKMSRRLGVPLEFPKKLGTVQHTITRHRITYSVYHVGLNKLGMPPFKQGTVRWVRWNQFDHYPMGAATHKIARLAIDSPGCHE
jgi:A/G-specific adenine glycosylase